jgi:predicted secreted protein
MLRKTLIKISSVIVLLTIAMTFIFWWWFLFPYKPLEIIQSPTVLNENKTVKIGTPLFYRVRFNKNTNKVATITRTLIDGVVYTLPATRPVNTKAGYYDQVINSLIIPQVPSGTYTFKTVACYQMNPIREICITYKSDEFIIIE